MNINGTKGLLNSLLVCATLSVAPLAHGDIIVVDFEADLEGFVGDGFESAGAAGVSFSDSVGAGLGIFNSGVEGDGLRSLLVLGDQDGSLLEITFNTQADFLSLDFGNDDPLFTNLGDLAVLTLFDDLNQVGQTIVELNRDDVMNQIIAFGLIGGTILFDSATFGYTDPFLQPFTGGGDANVGSTEVVDNIVVNVLPVTQVPAPPTILLLLTGLGLLILHSFRRKMSMGRAWLWQPT